MRAIKFKNFFHKSLGLLLWSISPLLLGYLVWQLLLPAPPLPIPTDVNKQNQQVSIVQLLDNSKWFTNFVPPSPITKKTPVEIKSTKLSINPNFKLLGVFLSTIKPAMAVVAPKGSKKSDVIIEGQKSSLGIVLVRANNPYEIEIENSNGTHSLLRIIKNNDIKSLYKQSGQSTNLYTNNNDNKVAKVDFYERRNKALENNPDNITIDVNKKKGFISRFISPRSKPSSAPRYKNKIEDFLFEFPVFSQLTDDKQEEVRELLNNPEMYDVITQDKVLFEGMLDSYKQLK